MSPVRKLYRSRDSMIFGVCGGLAEHLDLSPAGMRIIWVLLTFLLLGPLTLLAYVVMALVLKRRPLVPPIPGTGPYAVTGGLSRADAMRRLQQRSQALDRRLQEMESVVTRPSFHFDNECR